MTLTTAAEFPAAKVAMSGVCALKAMPVGWKIVAWLTGCPLSCTIRLNWYTPPDTDDTMCAASGNANSLQPAGGAFVIAPPGSSSTDEPGAGFDAKSKFVSQLPPGGVMIEMSEAIAAPGMTMPKP